MWHVSLLISYKNVVLDQNKNLYLIIDDKFEYLHITCQCKLMFGYYKEQLHSRGKSLVNILIKKKQNWDSKIK